MIKQFALTLALLTSLTLSAQKQPNIVILYADDMGYGDLGAQNTESKIPTPNLDRLAKEGMRFTDGHSSSGICTPSRYALLTGRHHWRDFHGIVGAMGNSVFKPERITLPEMLQDKGYNTAAIGKWHLGWDWTAIRKPGAKPKGEGRKKAYGPEAYDWSKSVPNGPLDHGFDYYFGDTVINFPPYAWIENDKLVKAPDTMMDESLWPEIKEGRWECRPGPMVTGWNPYDVIPTIGDKAVAYIQKQKKGDKPFFLYFAFPSPHAPIIPNDRFDGKSQAGPYGDFVYESDHCAGRILDALKEAGMEDNTLVFFSADNGPEKYAYERDAKFDHWSAKPFRGLKRDIYEGGHHVPFVIKWPGMIKAGSVSDQLVSQIDFMATVAAVVGTDLPKDAAEDSHNLLPLLKGSSKTIRDTHIHNTSTKGYAIRHKQWNLIAAKTGYVSGRNAAWEEKHGYTADDKAPVELYNIENDLGQRNNLADQHPEVVGELQSLLNTIREQGHSAPRLSP